MPTSSEALAAFLNGSGVSGNTGSAEINAFKKTLAENDIYKQAAAPILAAKFDTSTWTPKQTLATTAAQSFIGALLNAYGQKQESNQLTQLATVLPSLYANPIDTNAPDGVDVGAFAGLKAAAIEDKAQTNERIRQSLGEKGITIDNQGNIISDLFGASNAKEDKLTAKKQAEEDKFRKERLQKDIDEAKSLKEIQNAALALKDQNNPFADIGLREQLQKASTPQAKVVRAEFFRVINEAGSPLSHLKGTVNEWIGGGSLTPYAKNQIAQAISTLADAKLNNVKENIYANKTAADSRGYNWENVFPEAPVLFSVDNNSDANTNPNLPDMATFKAQAIAAGLTKEQAKAKWISMGGKP